MSGDTIRDELAAVLGAVRADPKAVTLELTLDDATRLLADAVLDWLGGLDPDCDRETVAERLRYLDDLEREVSKVYDHVTGGRISKPHTLAFEVIREADDVTMREVDRALAEREAEAPS